MTNNKFYALVIEQDAFSWDCPTISHKYFKDSANAQKALDNYLDSKGLNTDGTPHQFKNLNGINYRLDVLEMEFED